MIAVDSSSWIAYFGGSEGRDVDLLDEALARQAVAMPPVVLTELLSDPQASPALEDALNRVPMLEVREGYWQRAGSLRAAVLRRRLRARLADTLIAQSCLDSSVALLTRDGDFRHFARVGGLELAIPVRG